MRLAGSLSIACTEGRQKVEKVGRIFLALPICVAAASEECNAMVSCDTKSLSLSRSSKQMRNLTIKMEEMCILRNACSLQPLCRMSEIDVLWLYTLSQ